MKQITPINLEDESPTLVELFLTLTNNRNYAQVFHHSEKFHKITEKNCNGMLFPAKNFTGIHHKYFLVNCVKFLRTAVLHDNFIPLAGNECFLLQHRYTLRCSVSEYLLPLLLVS